MPDLMNEYTISSAIKGVKTNTIEKDKELEKPIQEPNSDSVGIGFSSIDQNWDQELDNRSVPNFIKYIKMLSQWNRQINLVQDRTLDDVLERHILDSEQICALLDKNEKIIDIGSGAGFPGVVLVINGFENVVLCEKNTKKAVFLKAVKEKLNLKMNIFQEDIYKFEGKGFVSVSRAFGSISKLLDVMTTIDSNKGVFHKGKTYKNEIEEAEKEFSFKYKIDKSKTNKEGVIVSINDVRKK